MSAPAPKSSVSTAFPVSVTRRWDHWINLAIAAFLMLATLPGRTQGLGLVTEPMLKDFQLDRVLFANLNLWATLLGAVCCLPVGRIIDRWGLRGIGTAVVLGLGITVWFMTRQSGAVAGVFATLFLTRALGQSALSVISITTVGKSFGSRTGLPMGIYAVALSMLFAAAFYGIGQVITAHGWRAAWSDVALVLLLVAAPLTAFGLRPTASSRPVATTESRDEPQTRLSLREALRTPTFWVFAGATALFGLVAGGLGLFNEAILAERGFNHETFYLFLAVTTLIALVGQVGCGWLSTRWPMPRLMALALLLYSASLAGIPLVKTLPQLWLVAVPFGLAGGMITTLFFAVWGEA
ncbi:MAG TPA: MFS transporter, partial [Candidatus Limnocylindria bacterium]|nr:MFS transporter [Candidatus Limnocylindria bacterium]